MVASSPTPLPPPILGLSHVALKVVDLERACAFYRDFLGFAEHCRLNHPDGSLMLVAFKISEDQSIEIFTGLRPGENRLHQIAFQVADADAMRRHLAVHGLAVPPSTPKGQMRNYNFIVRDPGGMNVEFVQYLPDGWTRRDCGRFLPPDRISQHLTRIGLPIADAAAVHHFYRDVLGLANHPDDDARLDPLAPGESSLLASPAYLEFTAAPAATPHFCLEVPDVAAVLAQLERSPYRATYPQDLSLAQDHRRRPVLNLLDPDGVRIELRAPPTARRASGALASGPQPAEPGL